MTAPALSVKELRRVVIAAAVGNVIEWYDFYIFGSLAALLSVKFFAAGASGSALIKTVEPDGQHARVPHWVIAQPCPELTATRVPASAGAAGKSPSPQYI